MYISKDRYIKVFLHLLIWSLLTVILFLYPTLISKGIKLPADFTIKQIVHLCLMLMTYYTNAYYLVPKFLLRNRYLLFGLGIVLLVGISSFILATVENWLDLTVQMKHIWGRKASANPYFDMFGFVTSSFTLGISTSISVINKWNKDNKERLNLEKERLNLEKERIKAELSFLKAQIHPHFFFNTLNTIYALSYVDAENSRKVLTKLSRMMRYLLYETDQNITTLEKELTFIRNYVEIMKLRLNACTTVEFNVPGEVLPMSIAPMILMPYVENAFKHGVDDEKEGTIVIHIEQNMKGIVLVTRNRIVPGTALTDNDQAMGIGMQNTRRRLDLIYKERYQLSSRVVPVTREFELKLELDLQ